MTVPYAGEYTGESGGERPAGRGPTRSPAGASPRDRSRPSGRERVPPSTGGNGRAGGGADSGSRRSLVVAAAGLVAVAVLAGGALMALSGDDDPGGDPVAAEGASDETPGSTTGAEPDTMPSTTEPPPPGPFVQIHDVELVDGQYRVNYQVTGYTPELDAGPEALHVHFFPDTQPPETAGTNGDESDDWDLTAESASFTTKYTPEMVAGATQMCSGVATHDHAVHMPEVRTGNCADLPG